MKIIAYLKPTCGWSMGVRAIMKKYNLSYEDRDIINQPEQYAEMVEKSGQALITMRRGRWCYVSRCQRRGSRELSFKQ